MTKLLCIEDIRELREDIAEELEDAGYEVVQACDGVEGLAAIYQHKPDLVVSDITMPNMSGIELVTELRENHPQFDDVPFLFLSALADRKDVLHGLKAGADDYITKPIDFDMLLGKVDSILRQSMRMKVKADKEQIQLFKALQKESAGKASAAPAGTAVPEAAAEAAPAAPAQQASGKGAAERVEKPAPPVKVTPSRVVLLGKKSKHLQEIETVIAASGLHVNVLTSSREYLAHKEYYGAELSLMWLESDDARAPKTMANLPRKAGRHVLVVPDELKDVLLKPVTSQFDDILTVPVSKAGFLRRLEGWLKTEPVQEEKEEASAFI